MYEILIIFLPLWEIRKPKLIFSAADQRAKCIDQILVGGDDVGEHGLLAAVAVGDLFIRGQIREAVDFILKNRDQIIVFRIFDKIAALSDDRRSTCTAHKQSGGRLVLFKIDDGGKIIGQLGEQCQIVLNIALCAKRILSEQDRQLRLNAKGRAKRFIVQHKGRSIKFGIEIIKKNIVGQLLGSRQFIPVKRPQCCPVIFAGRK